jgi:hypothetical protein
MESKKEELENNGMELVSSFARRYINSTGGGWKGSTSQNLALNAHEQTKELTAQRIDFPAMPDKVVGMHAQIDTYSPEDVKELINLGR